MTTLIFLQAAFQHTVPVKQGQQIAFQNPHAPAFPGLVNRKGLSRLLAIIELGQNELADPGHQRARRVSIILRGQWLPAHGRKKIADEHRCLLTDCRTCF